MARKTTSSATVAAKSADKKPNRITKRSKKAPTTKSTQHAAQATRTRQNTRSQRFTRSMTKPNPAIRHDDPNAPVQIFLKTTTGRTVALEVSLSATAAQLHQLIEMKCGIPGDQQRIIYTGKHLSAA